MAFKPPKTLCLYSTLILFVMILEKIYNRAQMWTVRMSNATKIEFIFQREIQLIAFWL